ncbi:MAG: capsular biosynthesis protein [Bacteroidetes bacterium]|nr:capsular biosynthesis protein [Bacteroidota bacterium]
MKTIAVIPVKEKSERVENKNFKEFADGLNLLEFKLNQVKESNCFDEVYISSDAEKGKILADRFGFSFVKRDAYFCNNITPWSEVIHHVASSIPVNDDDHIAWIHTTSPLFNRYKEAVEKYHEILKDGFDGLAAVNSFKEFIVTDKGRPYNYNWGVWHDYSQNLEKLSRITGALFITKKEEMIRNRYVISRKPYWFETSNFEAVDLDTPYDFKLAQFLYKYGLDLNNA